MTDSKKILKAIPRKIDGRFITDTQALSMPSLYEAIVELLTNVDDSYERIALKNKQKNWVGDCRIEYDLGGIKKSTFLIIKDRAEGMSYKSLCNNFGQYGARLSGSAKRGSAGRGAKDAAYIGELTIESILEDKYSCVKIDAKSKSLLPVVVDQKVTSLQRKDIGAKKMALK